MDGDQGYHLPRLLSSVSLGIGIGNQGVLEGAVLHRALEVVVHAEYLSTQLLSRVPVPVRATQVYVEYRPVTTQFMLSSPRTLLRPTLSSALGTLLRALVARTNTNGVVQSTTPLCLGAQIELRFVLKSCYS